MVVDEVVGIGEVLIAVVVVIVVVGRGSRGGWSGRSWRRSVTE
jgi:hypothetical protein